MPPRMRGSGATSQSAAACTTHCSACFCTPAPVQQLKLLRVAQLCFSASAKASREPTEFSRAAAPHSCRYRAARIATSTTQACAGQQVVHPASMRAALSATAICFPGNAMPTVHAATNDFGDTCASGRRLSNLDIAGAISAPERRFGHERAHLDSTSAWDIHKVP